jgi:hypothetical protein
MELTFSCPSCGTVDQVASLETAGQVVCRRCGSSRQLHAEAISEARLVACPWCLTSDLYIQKDFPQALGLFIVVVGFAISTVFWYYEMPVATFAVLLVSALVDGVLYYTVPDVTICYRCLSQVRGNTGEPAGRFHPFDLAIGERYRQERIRAQHLRERGASTD